MLSDTQTQEAFEELIRIRPLLTSSRGRIKVFWDAPSRISQKLVTQAGIDIQNAEDVFLPLLVHWIV